MIKAEDKVMYQYINLNALYIGKVLITFTECKGNTVLHVQHSDAQDT